MPPIGLPETRARPREKTPGITRVPVPSTLEALKESLTKTLAAVGGAALVVLAVCAITLRSNPAFGECRGMFALTDDAAAGGALERVRFTQGARSPDDTAEFHLLFDARDMTYTNARFVFMGTPPACNDVDIPAPSGGYPFYPPTLLLYRDVRTGAYAADGGGQRVVTFVRREAHGRRFMTSNLFTPRQVPAVVGLFALLALGVAAYRARLARAYATRFSTWTEGHARADGVVEGENGMAIASIGPGRAGPLLVDPAALAGERGYRSMPMLERRHIVRGSHAEWRAATNRRLRDARALAAVSTLASLVALAANLLAR